MRLPAPFAQLARLAFAAGTTGPARRTTAGPAHAAGHNYSGPLAARAPNAAFWRDIMITQDTLGPSLARLAQVLSQPQPLLEKTRTDLRADVAVQFAANRNQWAPLSPRYAARKAKRYGLRPILVASGRMSADWQAAGLINGYTLRYLAVTPYAKYHESSEPRKGNLPRRPLNYQAGEQALLRHTEAAIKAAWI